MVSEEILVLGGAGYIGSHTCVELVEAGYTPVIVDSTINSSSGLCTLHYTRPLDHFKQAFLSMHVVNIPMIIFNLMTVIVNSNFTYTFVVGKGIKAGYNRRNVY